MCRVSAILSTLELAAGRAGWSVDHDFGGKQQTPEEEEGGLPNCHSLGVDMGRPQIGSRSGPEGALQVTTPVVLA